jgi:ACS family pantothenate transporter-like MFS transporter
MFNFALQLFGTACLVVWKIPLGMHVVAYLLAACDGPLSPLYMAWANLLCGKDKQVRAMTLSMINAFGNTTTTSSINLRTPYSMRRSMRSGSVRVWA